ncbi:SO_0444 family Cu/Zn efflux transporter [Shewanella salipaludis]|uniref:SO_0444 family Cu/Zn efflux transporter n=1 Tax=Shewanella salipaludis TaxID=2723052 RepID=A0A972JMW6_9GAMM|nr:SO_0444 family Cu/Zn efflux transporter [Shewanella salipaludis]NMH66937.1 SO_0444 family Cu/Zn efflux transporter [Shewanella salipaludis]
MLVSNFIHLFLESAPWLLLGLLLAGMLKVFVPMAWMQKQLGGHGVKTVVKAALLGAPLPLCSCGVIPAAIGLRRAGASKAATTSFLVSTPETGVDSITVSYVLLGPFMAIVRPIAAVSSAIVAGLLVGRDEDEAPAVVEPAAAAQPAASCCASKADSRPEPVQKTCCGTQAVEAVTLPAESPCGSGQPTPGVERHEAEAVKPQGGCCSAKPREPLVVNAAAGTSCCAGTQEMATTPGAESLLSRLLSGLKYGATDMVRDTALWLLVGLFFAALVQTYVPGDFLAKWGDGILAMLVMVLVSVPMYICATASTPIAAGLLLAGVSPGAVLVFMMAGPATNIATLGVVTRELGKRALYGYLGGVLGVALVAGMLVNYLVDTFGFVVMPQIDAEHAMLPQGLVAISGIVLAVLMGKVLLEKLPRSWWRRSDCCS